MVRLASLLAVAGGGGAFASAPPLAAFDITSAPEGGWVWFVSGKAIRNGDETIVGYLSESDVKAVRIDNDDQSVIQTATLYNNFLDDDHEPPSFVVRPDGVILAAFAYHAGEAYVGIGPSAGVLPAQANVTNITSQLALPVVQGTHGYTYASIVHLSGPDRYYIFLRYHDEDQLPYFGYTYSDDGGATWADMTLVAHVTYHHLTQTGDRLDFCLSDHPQHGEGDNPAIKTSVYHMYFEGGDWFESDGTQIVAAQPFGLADMTKVYDGSTTKAWVWDVAMDEGNPRIAYATFPGNDGDEHTANRAHWNGSAWVNHEITDMGTYIPTELATGGSILEVYYSGGVVLDHADPDVAWVSKGLGSDRWDIYRATTSNDGASWNLTPLTSSGKNIRPTPVVGHDGRIQVVWMSGPYESYTNYAVGTDGAGS